MLTSMETDKRGRVKFKLSLRVELDVTHILNYGTSSINSFYYLEV